MLYNTMIFGTKLCLIRSCNMTRKEFTADHFVFYQCLFSTQFQMAAWNIIEKYLHLRLGESPNDIAMIYPSFME